MNNSLLLVDDDNEVLNINKKYFEQFGYKVSLAEDGKSALDAIDRGGRFDCIVLDIMMPGVDGFELCKMIKYLSKKLQMN